MAGFSDGIVEQAWRSSGGSCGCTQTRHGHGDRCNKVLLEGSRGDRDSLFCWEAHSISELHEPSASDCGILCCKCHYATFP